ncbi:MAG: DNA-3-methyladenine glycosylase I [Phycisphaerales bacterium]|nr:DNA-3-methyladenine glycosylase I [Phycisphaerales bacterium]
MSKKAPAPAAANEPTRCSWPGNDLAIRYHDREWGVPIRADRKLFEFLILEGAQAGLSWDTILRKRDRYREVFDGFDPERIARYNARKVASLLADPGIVRNRAKIAATITNARAFLELQEAGPGFSKHLWSFVDGEPIINRWKQHGQVPARTAESDAMSKDLKKRGFGFVGSTICYAFMQATGMVNDHLVTCYRHAELS